uniref:Uncharacterized protein n=1 Tax=Knipowitschia caucasica TaxID=637954 RepID=A0AAV2LQH8_KNICA
MSGPDPVDLPPPQTPPSAQPTFCSSAPSSSVLRPPSTAQTQAVADRRESWCQSKKYTREMFCRNTRAMPSATVSSIMKDPQQRRPL